MIEQLLSSENALTDDEVDMIVGGSIYLDPTKFIRYKVKSGETLNGIAMRHGIGPKELARLNHIQNPRLIRTGSYLIIPVGSY